MTGNPFSEPPPSAVPPPTITQQCGTCSREFPRGRFKVLEPGQELACRYCPELGAAEETDGPEDPEAWKSFPGTVTIGDSEACFWCRKPINVESSGDLHVLPPVDPGAYADDDEYDDGLCGGLPQSGYPTAPPECPHNRAGAPGRPNVRKDIVEKRRRSSLRSRGILELAGHRWCYWCGTGLDDTDNKVCGGLPTEDLENDGALPPSTCPHGREVASAPAEAPASPEDSPDPANEV